MAKHINFIFIITYSTPPTIKIFFVVCVGKLQCAFYGAFGVMTSSSPRGFSVHVGTGLVSMRLSFTHQLQPRPFAFVKGFMQTFLQQSPLKYEISGGFVAKIKTALSCSLYLNFVSVNLNFCISFNTFPSGLLNLLYVPSCSRFCVSWSSFV